MYFSSILKNVKFSSSDFEVFLRTLKPIGTSIYMDPPYFTNDARVFGEYGSKPFNQNDLERLFKLSCDLSEKDNRVTISYRNCTEFIELFGEFIVSEIDVQRNVGGFAGRRKTDGELLAVI